MAAVLFADISGFTALAARMAERGVAGTEELTQHLNACFRTMLRLLREAGGDVEKFAGDALLAVFRARPGEPDLGQATVRAAGCALAIIREIAGQKTHDLALGVHAGVGAGRIHTQHVPLDAEVRAFILAGDPLEQAAGANAAAHDGEAFLSREAASLAGERVETAGDGPGFVKILRVRGAAAIEVDDSVRVPVGAVPELHRYLKRSLLARASAGHSTAWLAELRRTSVVFVSIRGADASELDGDRLVDAAQILGAHVARFDGLLFDFLTDDKGLVAIVLFGVHNAHEDDAARAVRAALDLDLALGRAGIVAAVGVATGRVYSGVIGSETRKELAVVGDAMNLAARLMSAARRGVLCCPTTSREASARFTFAAVHGLRLKNVAPGFVAHRPLPKEPAAAPAGPRAAPVVGREVEWEALRQAVEQHRERPGFAAVVLVGEAGIGKSALVRQFQALHADGEGDRRVLRVAGDALDQVLPYHAWRQAAAELLGVDTSAPAGLQRAAIDERMSALPEVAPLAPLLSVLVPHAPPETTRTLGLEPQARAEQTRDLVLALLTRAAERGPLAIVVEDAHWFDSASWALVGQIATRGVPALLLVTTRPASDEGKARLAAFSALPQVSTWTLGPLSPRASAALACAKLGVASLSPGVESLIFERAAGHPFFTEELTLALRDAGLLRIERGTCMLATSDRGRTEIVVPDTLERVLTSRIDCLREPERLALKVASVLGRDFERETLREIFPGERRSLDECLAALSRAELLTAGDAGGLRFKHAITQDVGYSLLPFAQRRELHRAVAEHLEAHQEGDRAMQAAHLAHHWGHAAVPERALGYAEEAGKRALSRFANREAVHFFREALRFHAGGGGAADPARVARWESDLGLAHRGLGELAESRRHCESALARLALPIPAKTTRARLGLVARVVRMLATRPRVDADHRPDPAAVTAVNAYMQLATLSHYANDIEGMMFSAAYAVPLATRAGASIEVATLYGSVATMAAFAKVFPTARAFARGAHAVARGVGTAYCTGTVYQYTGHLAGCLGDLETLDRDMHRARDAYAELGPGRPFEEALTNLGYLYQFKGDLPRALETMHMLERSGRARDDAQTTGWGLVGQGRVLLLQGELAEALARLRLAEAVVSDSLTLSELFGNRSLARFRSGDIDAALADVARVVVLAEETPATSYTTLPGYAATMEVLLLTCFMGRGGARVADGRGGATTPRELAARMHRAFSRYARTFPIATSQKALWDGVMAALEGRAGKARAALERAVQRARSSPLRDDEAAALRWYARVQSGAARRGTLQRVAEKFAALGRTFEAREAQEHLDGARSSDTIAPWEGTP